MKPVLYLFFLPLLCMAMTLISYFSYLCDIELLVLDDDNGVSLSRTSSSVVGDGVSEPLPFFSDTLLN